MTEKLLDRIGALLAKAESTDSDHEAEALVAKAQQLATLHAVDLALARQRNERRRRRETPAQRKIVLGRRGERGLASRVHIFVAAARANDVAIDVASNSTYVLAFGFPSDLDVVEALSSSLATQMVAAANAAIRRGDHREEVYWSSTAQAWRSDARVFRSAFNHAYVATISERLWAAREDALAEHDAPSSTSGALVLARKADEVAAYHAATSAARGTWQGTRTKLVAWSERGAAAGHAAGRTARLAPSRPLPGMRPELG